MFAIRLSVESQSEPFRTLQLRSFFRQFAPGKAPEDYYRFIRAEIDEEELLRLWPEQAAAANKDAWQATLGECDLDELDKRIIGAVGGQRHWVLLGGPPCQAYSSAGIVGNRTKKNYLPERDSRYGLYREFIRVLASHAPAAFVLENVPGMLSARLKEKHLIEEVLLGLSNPGDFVNKEFGYWPDGPRYRLVSMRSGIQGIGGDPRSFIVCSENFGIPQTRHRVIIIGIRNDLDAGRFRSPEECSKTGVNAVIDDLPKIRSTLSRETDTLKAWRSVFRGINKEQWVKELKSLHNKEVVAQVLKSASDTAKASPSGCGSDFIQCKSSPTWNPDWYSDPRLKGIAHHEARPHIRTDLHRYIFCSSFGMIHGRSPKLPDFPESLLPDHQNSKSGSFKDRFRVLLTDKPSSTIISHLAKDGHAFIHPDPLQCRSITPREAARIQTFPDNYYFFGGQTSRFRQIGNAVPPWLARQIAVTMIEVLIPS